MKIKTSNLEKIFALLIKRLWLEGMDEVDLGDKDFYWQIGSPEMTDLTKTHDEEVGSLKDDLECLEELLTGNGVLASCLDFEHTASVLRFIAEELHNKNLEQSKNKQEEL